MTKQTDLDKLLNLDDFVTWLAKQDPSTRYDPSEGCSCAAARFLQAHGFPHAAVGMNEWIEDYSERKWRGNQAHEFDTRIMDAVMAAPIYLRDDTYDALLARIRAMQDDERSGS